MLILETHEGEELKVFQLPRALLPRHAFLSRLNYPQNVMLYRLEECWIKRVFLVSF